MAFTAKQLRAAIRLVGCDHDTLCHGFRWHIDDVPALAQMVAWTLQGHSRHAKRILNTLGSIAFQTWPTVEQQAIDRLTLADDAETEVPRWHRDGLVFQHVAWLASIIQRGNNVAPPFRTSFRRTKALMPCFCPSMSTTQQQAES
jgi:hypothetical protein